MSSHRYAKWWFQDWENDAGLRLCSLAAQGLWMRLLCIAHAADPIGHVLIDGQPPSLEDVAEIVGKPKKLIIELVSELERRRVFSRTKDGVIYNRRMVRDHQKFLKFQEIGKRGGNPALKGNGNGPVNGGGKARGYPPQLTSIFIDHRSESESARDPPGPVDGPGSRWQGKAYERTPETDAVIVALEAKTTRAPTEPKPAPISSEHLAALRAKAKLA